MTMTPESPNTSDLVVELAIARLSGEMSKQFAMVNGKLDLLTSEGVRNSADIAALQVRVSTLEKRVYVCGGAAAVVGAVGAYLAQLI